MSSAARRSCSRPDARAATVVGPRSSSETLIAASASRLLRARGDAVRRLTTRLAHSARLALGARLDPDHLSYFLDEGRNVVEAQASRIGNANEAQPATDKRCHDVSRVVCGRHVAVSVTG